MASYLIVQWGASSNASSAGGAISTAKKWGSNCPRCPPPSLTPLKSTNLQEIRQSMSKLYGRKLVPFLSPMLEDDLGKKVPVEVGNKIHERNFNKIKECIDMVAQHVNPGDRAIAIKLTAFMPIELLVCFSLFRCVERFLLYLI